MRDVFLDGANSNSGSVLTVKVPETNEEKEECIRRVGVPFLIEKDGEIIEDPQLKPIIRNNIRKLREIVGKEDHRYIDSERKFVFIPSNEMPTKKGKIPRNGRERKSVFIPSNEMPTDEREKPTSGREKPTNGRKIPTKKGKIPRNGREIPTSGRELKISYNHTKK